MSDADLNEIIGRRRGSVTDGDVVRKALGSPGCDGLSSRASDMADFALARLEARIERLEGALREIDRRGSLGHSNACVEIARAALAEEPYADVPGAGQRGC